MENYEIVSFFLIFWTAKFASLILLVATGNKITAYLYIIELLYTSIKKIKIKSTKFRFFFFLFLLTCEVFKFNLQIFMATKCSPVGAGYIHATF